MEARLIAHPAALKVDDLILYEHREKGIRMYKVYEFGITEDGYPKIELTCLTEQVAPVKLTGRNSVLHRKMPA